MSDIVDLYCKFPAPLRRPMWKIWHRLLIRFDNERTVHFMNYGYAPMNGHPPITLHEQDEKDRYCIQLYDHVVNSVDLQKKIVLEVGSGRGGGAHYIARYYKPDKYTGVDISPGVIGYCNKAYNVPGLSFKEGRAEKIPVGDESHDAVVNVESARCYSNLMTFFREVHRVLVPGGHFLFADMIEKEDLPEVKKKLLQSGFTLKKETEITQNVVRGLELDNQRRESLISNKIPSFLQKYFRSFAGTMGTKRFDSFQSSKFQYWSFVLVKA
ncbi:MAG: class I SAM-dependent methyltransferase [Bacteroidota bacterium]